MADFVPNLAPISAPLAIFGIINTENSHTIFNCNTAVMHMRYANR